MVVFVAVFSCVGESGCGRGKSSGSLVLWEREERV